jgi:hypothetical protein
MEHVPQPRAIILQILPIDSIARNSLECHALLPSPGAINKFAPYSLCILQDFEVGKIGTSSGEIVCLQVAEKGAPPVAGIGFFKA